MVQRGCSLRSKERFHKICAMRLQVEIGFEELVRLARQLSVSQWTKLKNEVEKKKSSEVSQSDMESFLLNAPTFSRKQLSEVEKARKSISKWRIK